MPVVPARAIEYAGRMKTTRILEVAAIVCLASLASACAPAAQPRDNTAASRPEPGKATPEAMAAFNKTMQQNLQQCEQKTEETDKKLAEALDKLAGGKPDMTGKPMPKLSEVVAKLQKEKVSVTLKNVGSPEMPTLMVEDSFTQEGQKLAGAPQAKMMAYAKRAQVVQPLLTALRDQVNGINGAMGTSFQSTIACSQYAKAFATGLGALDNGDNEPTTEVFETFAKLLQANEKSKVVVAGSVALLGVAQAGLLGKDVKAIDMLLDGIRQSKENPEKVTPDVARKTYKAAGQALVDACREQQEKAYKDHPELKRPAVDPCSKEGSRVKGSPAEEKARAEARGESGGNELIDEGIRRFIPKDSPLGDVAGALQAAQKGDVLGALNGVANLIGRATPLGGVFKSVLSLFG